MSPNQENLIATNIFIFILWEQFTMWWSVATHGCCASKITIGLVRICKYAFNQLKIRLRPTYYHAAPICAQLGPGFSRQRCSSLNRSITELSCRVSQTSQAEYRAISILILCFLNKNL
jgi:hypothetical protein